MIRSGRQRGRERRRTTQVLADTDRIKEVVVNLVGNAIKYMGGAERSRFRMSSWRYPSHRLPMVRQRRHDACHAHRGYRHRHVGRCATKLFQNSIACRPIRRRTSRAPAWGFHRQGNNREDGRYDRGRIGRGKGVRSVLDCRWRMGRRHKNKKRTYAIVLGDVHRFLREKS